MAELVVVGPLGELHLRDELRLHPVRRLVRGRRRHIERTRRRLQPRQLGHHARQLRVIEPAADVRDVDELLALVDAEQQRAESAARAARLGPSADDELLLADELQLRPIGRALARDVFGRRALGDQAFPAFGNRSTVELAPVAGHLLGDAQKRRAGIAEDAFERGAPRDQRHAAQVVRAVGNDVERDERRGRVVGLVHRLHVDAALEVLEADRPLPLVERDNLAVEDDALLDLQRKAGERLRDGGELRGLVVAEARKKTDLRHGPARADVRDRPDAVVLGFVDEVRLDERNFGGRRQHRRDGRLPLAPDGRCG